MNSAPIKPLISDRGRTNVRRMMAAPRFAEYSHMEPTLLQPCRVAQFKNSATEIRSNNSRSSPVQNLGANRREYRFMAGLGRANWLRGCPFSGLDRKCTDKTTLLTQRRNTAPRR
jgi:hypothetical protein